jgi:hypothetical protein
MALKWEQRGSHTWRGEDGWQNYHIERKGRFYRLARGNIVSADWLGAFRILGEAKAAAQKEAAERADKILAPPNHGSSTAAGARLRKSAATSHVRLRIKQR